MTTIEVRQVLFLLEGRVERDRNFNSSKVEHVELSRDDSEQGNRVPHCAFSDASSLDIFRK